jgi:hypothetical protein
MVEQMVINWLGLFPDYQYRDDPSIVEHTRENMSRLLFSLEHKGMLPPCALIPIPNDETPLVPGDFKNDEGVWCTPKHEWEKE